MATVTASKRNAHLLADSAEISGNLVINGTITAPSYNNSNWDTAYGWGNHADAGYLTSIPTPATANWWNGGFVKVGTDGVMEMGKYMDFHTSSTGGSVDYDLRVTVAPGVFTVGGQINATGGNSGQWNIAYGWGNHASQGYATQTYVNNAVSNLVDSAPATLDTLNELAAALGDDPNFATTVTNSIGTKVSKAGDTMTGTLTVPNLTIGSGNRIKFANNDFIRYDDANGVGRFHFDCDGGTNNASVQAATFVGALSGNASTSSRWATARTNTVTLTGDVTGSGSASVDGSGNWTVTVPVTVSNDSHTHDTRYVRKTGDTMTGALTINNSMPKIHLNDTSDATIDVSLVNDGESFYIVETEDSSGIQAPGGGRQWFKIGDDTSGVIDILLANGSGTNKVFHDTYHPNADKWTTARTHTVTLTGDVSGSASQSVDGTGNRTWTISTTVGDDSHFHHRLDSTDDRDVKPNTTGISSNVQAIKPFFTSLGGMTGTANTDYQDLLVLDTYSDTSGGKANAISMDKSDGAMRIWNANQGDNTWGTGQRVFADNYHPNADKWTTARTHTVTLTGEVTGTASQSVDGSGNRTWTISTTLNNSALNDQYVNKTGDTMTGNLNFTDDGEGITWNRNTDGASILFYNDSDSDTNSRLEFNVRDNGNEFFRWTSNTTEWMKLIGSTLTVKNFYITQEGTHGTLMRGISSIAFRNVNDTWTDPQYHGIRSTDNAGNWGDDISINSYHDVSVRLDSNNNNGSGYFRVYHDTAVGGGDLPFWTGNNGSLNQSRLSGNVGINAEPTTNSYKLNMGGSVHMNNNAIHYASEVHFNDGIRWKDNGNNTDLVLRADSTSSVYLKMGTQDNHRGGLYADSSNNVGILDGDNQWAVRVVKDSYVELRDNNEVTFRVGQGGVDGNFGSVQTHDAGKGGWAGYSIEGRVVFMHDIDTANWGIYNDVDNEWMIYGDLNGKVDLRHNGTIKLETNSTGVEVIGLLTATQKSFTIDHPTKEGYKLRYGSLEGPENGVYVRGRLKGTNTIELPEYWKELVHEDSITVNLTPIGKGQDIWVEDFNTTEVVVGGENVNCFYTVYGERKDVDKLITEFKEVE